MNAVNDTKTNKKTLLLLHALLMVFSFGGVFAKLAAAQSFLSPKFLFFYGCEVVILFIYAIGWQQVLKRMPLTAAFSNKGVVIIWALIWGRLFFSEEITPRKIIGSLIIITGIIIYAGGEKNDDR